MERIHNNKYKIELFFFGFWDLSIFHNYKNTYESKNK